MFAPGLRSLQDHFYPPSLPSSPPSLKGYSFGSILGSVGFHIRGCTPSVSISTVHTTENNSFDRLETKVYPFIGISTFFIDISSQAALIL